MKIDSYPAGPKPGILGHEERARAAFALLAPLDFLGCSGQDQRVSGLPAIDPSDDALALLAQFQVEADPGPLGVPWTHHFGGSPGGPHTVIGFVTHGNESGSLPALLRLVRDLSRGALDVAGSVTLLVGNPEAVKQNVRFIEEDFNRVFTFDVPAESLERKRAEEVRPLLERADYFLDFHQTQTPTEAPFWTLPWSGDLPTWARVVGGASLGLTRRASGVFSVGKRCLDEYVRDRGKVGITIELGEKGPDREQAERTYECALRFLAAITAISRGTADLEALAAAAEPISWYETRDVVPAASSEHRLRPGLDNWTAVEAGELLSPAGAPEIRASAAGRILFPKYTRPGDPPPPELFRLGVFVEDPARVFG